MNYTNSEAVFLVVAVSMTLSFLYAFPTTSSSLWQLINDRIEDYKRSLGLYRAIPEDKKYLEIDVRDLH